MTENIEQFANNARSTLVGNLSAGATSLTLANPSLFPASGSFRLAIDSEILLVAGAAGPAYSVIRGYEGTAAAGHGDGAAASLVNTAEVMRSLKPRRFPYIIGALIGDSYHANGFTYIPGQAYTYGNNNAYLWARTLCGGGFDIPMGYNLAVGGTYALDVAASADAAIALNPDVILMDGGRNDFAGGRTYAQVIGYMMPTAAKILRAGIDVIWLPVVPESSVTAVIQQHTLEYNRTIYELCSGRRPDLAATFGFPPNRLPTPLDISFLYDAGTGNSLTGYSVNDGTHLTSLACFLLGKQLKDNYLGPRLAPRPTNFCGYNDVYNATTHPRGTLLTNGTLNYGQMIGTAGTKQAFTGVTPTGTVATAYNVIRANGSSAATVACSIENPRADGLSGTGQVIQIDTDASGVVGELYGLNFVGTDTLSIHTNIIPGQKVYFTGTYEVLDAPAYFLGVQFALAETGNATNQTATDGAAIQDVANRGPNAAYKGYFRTASFAVQAGTTKLSPNAVVVMDGRGAGHVKVAFRDFAVRYE